jgi:hypothetical protein
VEFAVAQQRAVMTVHAAGFATEKIESQDRFVAERRLAALEKMVERRSPAGDRPLEAGERLGDATDVNRFVPERFLEFVAVTWDCRQLGGEIARRRTHLVLVQ